MITSNGPTARRRRAKAGRLKREENANKQQVRDRDRVCRFPLCPCKNFDLFLEVSHSEHKGMGGDPTGERSAPELMVLICNWRHRLSRYSIDRKTLRWRPLTAAGANGLIVWEARIPWLFGEDWREIARELGPGRWDVRDAPGGGIFAMLPEELVRHFR